MSLDKCINLASVTGSNCVTSSSNTSCTSSAHIPVGICHPTISTAPSAKCVNDNVRRPWPSPPPAELGCNPITVQVTNSPTADDDPNQSIYLEGNVSYIAGDACLPQMNLNLVVPPAIAAGGGSPSVSGFGYTQYGPGCVRVGSQPADQYKTPQDFYGNEPGAAAFHPKSASQMGPSGCEDNCTAKSTYGANVAKFNLIGPILAEIQSYEPVMTHFINGERIVTGWKYKWAPSICVIAADSCMPGCTSSNWTNYNNGLSYQDCWNNKENVIDGMMTPGVDLEDMLKKGYKPQPIQAGTPVMVYGWVPWGTDKAYNSNTGKYEAVPNTDSCGCDMVWFFSEQNAFAGECATASSNSNPSMLPSRRVNSAGMFFGSSSNANRV